MNSIKIILAYPIQFDCFIVLNPGVCVEVVSIGSERGDTAPRGTGTRTIFPPGSLCTETMADSVECQIVLSISLQFVGNSNKDNSN